MNIGFKAFCDTKKKKPDHYNKIQLKDCVSVITILLGPNGTGKSMSLRLLEEECKKKKINYLKYSNEQEDIVKKAGWDWDPYKLACAFQSTEYHDIDDASDIVPYGYGTIGTGINTIYPENTQCNTFYFSSKPTEQVKQALVNYCQYLYGVNGGYNSGGCIVCTDASGMYRAPGYNIDNYYYCLAEECSNHWKDENVAKELYEVYNNSTAKKKSFHSMCNIK